MLVRLIALLVTVAMWPGLSALVELTAHAAEHGDLAHAGDDEHDGKPLGEDEHGCSGTFHLCPCHHSPSAVAAAAMTGVSVAAMTEMRVPLAPPYQLGMGMAAPPTRPPIV